MQKNLGIVLLGIGSFLLLIGLMAVAWAPGQVKRTPIDVDSVTNLEGEVAAVQNGMVKTPAKAVSVTKIDSKLSTDDVALWVSTSCLVLDQDGVGDCVKAPDERLISADVEFFATDRVTALGTASSKLPSDTVKPEGLVNKFPFDTEKKTYPYWDSMLGEAVDAVYARTAKVSGVETYVFEVNIDEDNVVISAGDPGTEDDVLGTYTDKKEIYVEPRTGSILNQTDDQQRVTADGTPVLDLQLAFTAAEQKESAEDAKDNIGTLNLVLKTVPIIGFSGGLLAVGGGLFLILGDRRRTTA